MSIKAAYLVETDYDQVVLVLHLTSGIFTFSPEMDKVPTSQEEKVTAHELVCLSNSLFVYAIKDNSSQTFKLMELEVKKEENSRKVPKAAFSGCIGDIIAI